MGGFQSAFRIIRISDVIRVEIPVSAEFNFTWDFRGISAVFPYRGHKCTAKFPLRKSRLIGKNFPCSAGIPRNFPRETEPRM